MTKKDYELIERNFKHEIDSWRDNSGAVYGTEAVKALTIMVKILAISFKGDNPRFNKRKFLTECGIQD